VRRFVANSCLPQARRKHLSGQHQSAMTCAKPIPSMDGIAATPGRRRLGADQRSRHAIVPLSPGGDQTSWRWRPLVSPLGRRCRRGRTPRRCRHTTCKCHRSHRTVRTSRTGRRSRRYRRTTCKCRRSHHTVGTSRTGRKSRTYRRTTRNTLPPVCSSAATATAPRTLRRRLTLQSPSRTRASSALRPDVSDLHLQPFPTPFAMEWRTPCPACSLVSSVADRTRRPRPAN